MSSSIDFDQILTLVGDRGKYQTLMFLVLCIPATLPVAFLTFSNLFTNAVPDHWCRPGPEFNNVTLGSEDLKLVTVPSVTKENGEVSFNSCYMYDTRSNDIFRELVESKNDTISEGWLARFDDLVEGGNVSTKKCTNGWVYDTTYYDRTLITELNLVCDNRKSPQTNTALFYVGSLFGNAFFGWVADRWGRRTSMLWMIILEVLVSILTSFSLNYQMYLVLRTIGGIFFPALYQIPFILGIEMMAPKHRPLAGMIICNMFAAAMCILPLLAYFLRDWFKLSIATSVPFLLLYSYYWIIPESPRWLFSKGKLNEAESIIQRMAHYNGVTIPKRVLYTLQENQNLGDFLDEKKSPWKSNCQEGNKTPLCNTNNEKRYDRVSVSDGAEKDVWNMQIGFKENKIDAVKKNNFNKVDDAGKSLIGDETRIPMVYSQTVVESEHQGDANILDMMRYPNARKKFFLLTFVWISNAVVYNGLSYNVTNLGVNDFLAFFISAAIELPSNLAAWKLMDICGRKWLLCATLTIGGMGCLSCMFVPEDQVWVTVAFAMIGKFGVAASFAVFYVFVGESFPTVVRSQAMGVSSILASVGLLIFPYILQLGQYTKVLPMIMLGILAVSGALANLFLPDTLNMPMPQTLEDGENFGKDMKIFSMPKRRASSPST